MASTEGDPGPGREPAGPSWVDRLLASVDRLPGPAWLAYAVTLGAVLIISHVVAWIEGVVPSGGLDAFRASLALYVVAGLAALVYFGRVARAAFARFRPVLAESEAPILEREFATLPGGPALAWVLGMVALAFVYIALGPDPSILMQEQPLTFAFDVLVTIVSFSFAGLWSYAVIRQLRLVGRAHDRAVNIDLFRPDPLYSFSGLTARLGGALLALAYLSAATDPTTFTNPALAAGIGGSVVLAIACFVLPLLGMHRRIVEEKVRLETRAGESLGRTLDELDRRIVAGDDPGAAALTRVLEALVIERDLVARIRTWPWRVETLRGFASAVVLPIALWLTFRVLERALG